VKVVKKKTTRKMRKPWRGTIPTGGEVPNSTSRMSIWGRRLKKVRLKLGILEQKRGGGTGNPLRETC